MGNYIPFRLPFQAQDNTDVEVLGSNLAMTYHFPPKSGSYFANHFVMAGEKFENTTPEKFLCGENNDLNYLTNKPIPFPYQNASADEPSNTIRSLVHLRRDSLKLIRVEQAGMEESDVYRVECVFDTDVACAIRIFLMATEDLSNGSAKYKSRKPDYCSEPMMFDRGPGQLFKSKFYIKPDEFQPSELNYIPGAVEVPLVVQITVEDSAFIGQSESTFAGIEKLSEGTFAIKFMKQKIMVDGLCFMTQEIYGIENKTAAQKAEDDEPEEDNTECVICMTNIRDTLMLPCRHLCLCNICAEEMRTKQSRCPICRANFHALLQIKGVRRKKKTADQASGDSAEELEEISIIEALNGDLLASEENETECDLKRRSSSARSRRSRPRSTKSNRSESRSRGSTRSLKTEAIVKQEIAPSAPSLSPESRSRGSTRSLKTEAIVKQEIAPSAPPLSPAFIEMLHQKKCEDDSENEEVVDTRIDALGTSTRSKILSSIVVDSVEVSNTEEKPCSHLDPSLPGTPMGSDGSESLAVSLNSSLSSQSSSKSTSQFSTRAQITTPSNVTMDDCSPSPSPPSPENGTDERV